MITTIQAFKESLNPVHDEYRYFYLHTLPIVDGSMDENGEGAAYYIRVLTDQVGDGYYDVINAYGLQNPQFHNDISNKYDDVDQLDEITKEEYLGKYLK